MAVEKILKEADKNRLVTDFGVNVMNELMILNRSAYHNMLDEVKLTRDINLERIKYFSGKKF
jgi:hypothetical protein